MLVDAITGRGDYGPRHEVLYTDGFLRWRWRRLRSWTSISTLFAHGGFSVHAGRQPRVRTVDLQDLGKDPADALELK